VRRYTQQQRCSVPVWFEPQPLASNADQDLGWRLSGTHAPLSHLISRNDDDQNRRSVLTSDNNS
jgi:hypothetical protein